MLEPDFLSLEDILEMHDEQIERYGGSTGVRDMGALESALAVPQSTFGGNTCMPRFQRCQPRTCFTSARIIHSLTATSVRARTRPSRSLLLNDWEPLFDEDELVQLVLSIASGVCDKQQVTAFLRERSRPLS